MNQGFRRLVQGAAELRDRSCNVGSVGLRDNERVSDGCTHVSCGGVGGETRLAHHRPLQLDSRGLVAPSASGMLTHSTVPTCQALDARCCWSRARSHCPPFSWRRVLTSSRLCLATSQIRLIGAAWSRLFQWFSVTRATSAGSAAGKSSKEAFRRDCISSWWIWGRLAAGRASAS